MMRAPALRLYPDEVCADLFAGGGGASTGIAAAVGRDPDVAINHDREALAMHRVNHPTTRHLREDVRDVDPVVACHGKRCGLAWFSPDCTYFSKARSAKPFRDRHRARRIRGLAWVAVRWAASPVKPRIILLENVEEWKDWGPLGPDGRPIPEKRGRSFRQWKGRLEALGYVVDWRELRASDYGSPTTRKRLFVVARCDGLPIQWPTPTHGPHMATRQQWAADHLDFTIPVPSIFLTPAQAKAWGKRYGVASPRRPLARATQRRIARGVQRYVLDTADPFIVPTPEAITVPALINTRNGERVGQAPRVRDIRLPFGTITAQGSQGALVSAILVNNSELRGDRVYPVTEPIRTLTHAGCRTYQLVAAFLAKHNGGHEATGQRLQRPIDALTTVDQKALVTSLLVNLRGHVADHPQTAQDVRTPIRALTAGGTHIAEARVTLVPREALDGPYAETAVKTCAFLIKFFGTGVARRVDRPVDALTTKDRVGLVQVLLVRVRGHEYILADIGMRMLSPRELFSCQGFPVHYEIEQGVDFDGVPVTLTKRAQTRLVGNSVPPHVAAALVRANMSIGDVRA